jgi:hypothetical protein
MTRHHRLLIAVALFVLVAVPVFAGHGWSNYHWGRSCGTCAASIQIYSSLTTTNTNWADHLNKSVFGDPANPNAANRRGWNDSSVLALSISAGGTSASTRYNCPTISNAVRVCNYTYGSNGWLGLAQINLNSSGHIAWGKAKMNDTYFNSGYPVTEKRHVMCQEVGHDFGLGHTSENGSSQNTCMDYYQNTSASDWTSTGPNQHDFDQLLTQHHYGALAPPPLSTLSAAAGAAGEDLNEPWQWGTPFSFDHHGRAVGFRLELDEDSSIVTYVRWADPEREPRERRDIELGR